MSATIDIYVGFDNSDSDIVGTWRPCNRRNGNSAVFVQTFACLEGAVSEDYANEMVTIGKPEYPVRYTIQSLVDDSMQALVLSEMVVEEGRHDGHAKSCGCFIFIPSPPNLGRGLGFLSMQLEVFLDHGIFRKKTLSILRLLHSNNFPLRIQSISEQLLHFAIHTLAVFLFLHIMLSLIFKDIFLSLCIFFLGI